MLKTTLKILTAAALAVLLLSALAAVAALLLYGIVLAAAALLIALLASPEEFRAVCRGFADRADGWLGRLEAQWQSVRETLDRWGEREMARRNPAEESGEAVSPVRSDAPERS